MYMNVVMGLAFRIWSGALLLALTRRCPGCSDMRLLQWWAASIVEGGDIPKLAVNVAAETLIQFERNAGQSWLAMATYGQNDPWTVVDYVLGHTVPEQTRAASGILELAARVADVEVADRSDRWPGARGVGRGRQGRDATLRD